MSIDWRKIAIYAAVIIFAVWWLVSLMGCYGSRAADRQLQKAMRKYPVKVAKLARDEFPCVTTGITQGATITIIDSNAIRLADSLLALKPVHIVTHDTVCDKEVNDHFNEGFNLGRQVGKAEGSSRIQMRTDTLYKEDSAAIYVLHSALNLANDTIVMQRNTIASDRAIIRHKSKENWIWRIIAAIYVGWQIIRIYNRLSKPIV